MKIDAWVNLSGFPSEVDLELDIEESEWREINGEQRRELVRDAAMEYVEYGYEVVE